MDAARLQSALDLLGPDARHLALYHRTPLAVASPHIVRRTMPADAQAAARELFGTLRDLDALGVKSIWIEPPPDTPEWEGVYDRLQRAAAA